MTTYVALLRGIGPINPNIRPAKLAEAFEKMGFKNVRTVISSGNVVFSSSSKSPAALEKKIEKALPDLLGFTSTTIIRSKQEIDALIKKNPVKGLVHGVENYLLVTFLKRHLPRLRTLPKKGPGVVVLAVYKRELCVAVNMSVKTPDIMLKAEREFGKEITSRTWKTVERIAAKMVHGK